MKNLKYFFLLFFMLFITGCETTNNNLSDEEILTKYLESLTLPETTSNNLTFNTKVLYENKEIQLIWVSSNPELISNEGNVCIIDEDFLVSITVEVSLGSYKQTKYFDVLLLASEPDDLVDAILETILVPSTTKDNLTLPTRITYNNKNYTVSWSSSNKSAMKNNGEILYSSQDANTIVTASIKIDEIFYTKDYNIVVEKTEVSIFDALFIDFDIPTTTSTNINLITSGVFNSKKFTVKWTSSNKDMISNNGITNFVFTDTEVTLTAALSIDNMTIQKDFIVNIEKTDSIDIIETLLHNVELPGKISNNIYLQTEFPYGIIATWTSSNTAIISNNGIIGTLVNNTNYVTLKLELEFGGEKMTKDFDVSITNEQHLFIDRTFEGSKNNVEINKNGKLVLTEGSLLGTYTSKEINTIEFTEAVASWAALTSKTATCEVEVRLLVNGVWSDYITYGKWGLGLQNGSNDQTKNLIKLSTDEIIVLNSKKASAFQMKITLRRDTANIESPVVTLLALTLKFDNYTYTIDNNTLLGSKRYSVPKLYQHEVPTIGGIICSATCSTMLLNYKGHSFVGLASYEHQYIASLVKDYINNIYGNWVFNCVGMSAFGETAYVKRFYSLNEMLYHLDTVGPLAASIKGPAGNPVYYSKEGSSVVSSYTSNGHLITITGYEIINNQITIFINDPNVSGVAISMTANNFMNVWRYIGYIVE